jgi:hypothetical protein
MKILLGDFTAKVGNMYVRMHESQVQSGKLGMTVYTKLVMIMESSSKLCHL